MVLKSTHTAAVLSLVCAPFEPLARPCPKVPVRVLNRKQTACRQTVVRPGKLPLDVVGQTYAGYKGNLRKAGNTI